MRNYFYAAGAALVVALAGFVYWRGVNDAENEAVRRRLDAMQEKKVINDDVKTMDDQRLIDILTGR